MGLIIDEMLDNSFIYYHDLNANSHILILDVSKYHWDKKDQKGQIRIRQEYNSFYSNFELLLNKTTPRI